MKTYIGRRRDGGCVVTVREGDGRERPLDLRNDLWNHSPDGAEWGYGGSGPAQLALGFCADVLGDDRLAVDLHQEFKFRVVGGLAREGWELTEETIRNVLERLQHERDQRAGHDG